MTPRPLTPTESEVLARFAEKLPAGERLQLTADMQEARALDASLDGSRVLFEIAQYSRPAYQGQHPLAAEGRVLDRDGAELSVLVHADHEGRLFELEIVRYDPGDVIGPDWSTLRVF